ncbi:MAG: 2-oxoglutarate dehydrogenase complex dihydrolipoyllysine-residue succinyltransferase, partial [Alphaproteobacteria bacterium]|nr:2-oxoglutarate dehydrogenase complex dihydrolipoyllysine-residue succinyltransferase [Alphaproteobacteria bacterium]
VEVGSVLCRIDETVSPALSAGKREPEVKPVLPAGARGQRETELSPGLSPGGTMPASPSARKLIAEQSLSPSDVTGSGRRGQILKSDVHEFLSRKQELSDSVGLTVQAGGVAEIREERVRMSKLRRTIAKRLKDAQESAAILTTFNEVDMSGVVELRQSYKSLFEKKQGIKLGFLGFFVKACVQALHEIPSINAEIDGEEIIYKNYYHIGVAVGTDRGLVVPVLRGADSLSFSNIEKTVADFGTRARKGHLRLEEMQGGTFTISNGGVYGSLMSTPILNLPQSGILGMHKIEERPVVVKGEIVIRPMMYLALSYDHRIVDGKEAVTFLVRVKELIEDPRRLLLDL